jgi:hypothetical protein
LFLSYPVTILPGIFFAMYNPDFSPRDFFLSKAKIKWQRKRT